ncbi:Ubiquitin fusion degradation protein 1 [Babesia sp. Xinjiang]|uniref:Ubiquitin fusion degradation protein 1 n=1 Tax=Babesia sp. Xinjiang TaxID=462227 RepID=UPI000A24DEF1|nr:Ubiquitin fusion degradation protein 1 [Babesia sp. Xinjiang]ORM39358.1 Ubiquitin fusion degradation protein 1 [Babesia sp. Xinjiang]
MIRQHALRRAVLALLLLSLRIAGGLSHRIPRNSNVSSFHPLRCDGRYQYAFSFLDRFRRSLDRARVEGYVREVNILLQQRPVIERLLVVLELGEPFSRSCRSADGSHMLPGNSDKASLPESILAQLTDRDVSVPWQFLIQKVHRSKLASDSSPTVSGLPSTKDDLFTKDDGHKERLACSSLDFRPQDNFIFLPRWMMESLELQPYDVVYLTQLKLNDATFVRLAPIEQSFFSLPAPKAVLEEHLKHYSTLTRGSTIQITHEGVTYHLKVLRIETEDCKDAECASIQDTDVSTDLVKLQ